MRLDRSRVGRRLGVLLVAASVAQACVGGRAPHEDREGRTDDETRAELARMVDEVAARFPDVRTVSADEAIELLRSDRAVMVDVRSEAERGISTIPGAVTAAEFRANPTRFAGLTPVAYCTIGYRSAQFVRAMADEGVEVLNLEGSILAWTHAGGELVGPDGPTTAVHVYGPEWNLAAEAYETTW